MMAQKQPARGIGREQHRADDRGCRVGAKGKAEVHFLGQLDIGVDSRVCSSQREPLMRQKDCYD